MPLAAAFGWRRPAGRSARVVQGGERKVWGGPEGRVREHVRLPGVAGFSVLDHDLNWQVHHWVVRLWW